jgi:hypothetical protein
MMVGIMITFISAVTKPFVASRRYPPVFPAGFMKPAFCQLIGWDEDRSLRGRG